MLKGHTGEEFDQKAGDEETYDEDQYDEGDAAELGGDEKAAIEEYEGDLNAKDGREVKNGS